MCDHVFEVDSCPKGIRAVVPHGFTLETHDIVLYGRCDRCATRRGASAVSRTALASASR
jgi:Fur family ferric uptake transcriptional regulator